MLLLSSFHTKAHLPTATVSMIIFNILIPSYWRKKAWIYFSLVSWFSALPVGACSEEDSLKPGKRLTPLASTFQKSGLSPSYSPSLAGSAERHGRPYNRDISTSQSQDAAPSPILPYLPWQVNYQVWQLIFARGISAAVLEMLYKYRKILLMLLMAKMLGPSLSIGEGSPTPGSHIPQTGTVLVLSPVLPVHCWRAQRTLPHVSSNTALAHPPAHRNTNMLPHTQQEPQSTKTI